MLYQPLIIIIPHSQWAFNALWAPLQELHNKLLEERTHSTHSVDKGALMSVIQKEGGKSSPTLSPNKRSKQALILVKRSSLHAQLEVICSIHIKTQNHFPALALVLRRRAFPSSDGGKQRVWWNEKRGTERGSERVWEEKGSWERGDGTRGVQGKGGGWNGDRAESGEEKSSYPKVSAPESNLSPILGA